jgi:hypothetical protein
LVVAALLVPNSPNGLGLNDFIRIPVEGLVLFAVLLVLPPLPRRIVAIAAGVVLGLMTIVKAFDIGFWVFLNRQFDLVADWGLFDDGQAFIRDTFGRAGEIAATALAVLLVISLPVLLTLAILRLSRFNAGHRKIAGGSILTLTAAWVVLALLGTQIVPGLPIASTSQLSLTTQRVDLVRESIADQKAFTTAIAVDKFAATPADRLLTGLRGKDVVFSLVESYGRSALEDPLQAAIVAPALAEDQKQLTAAGFGARSGFLTSSTFGGYSWLAHSTFQSGMWIDRQNKYRTLTGTQRLTLTGSFKKAGWKTVAVEPGNTYAWPEGDFYGYETVLDDRTLGYKGPRFGWSSMPDQYTLAQFQKDVYGKPHPPTAAEVTLTSSHTPWAPIPEMIDWDQIGDGSIYAPMEKSGKSSGEVWKDSSSVRTEFAKSIAYSVTSLTSWAQKYGRDNLVLVFLGDHQAAPIVSGKDATHDVPITIVAKDPKILDKVSKAWGWQNGLNPSPQAPVMRMDAFRDNFLNLFGPENEPH